MKKLLTSLLFFGSFGLASATTGIWNPPVPNPNSCGTHTVPAAWKINQADVHCESPWHMPLSGYIPGGGSVADQVNGFKARHPSASFELVDMAGNRMPGGCNSFSVSVDANGSFGGTCNSARLIVKTSTAFSSLHSLTASAWGIFRSAFLGVRPARVAPAIRGFNNPVAPVINDSVQGCQAYATETLIPAHEEANYCPQQDQCQSIGMSMTNLESMIWMMKNPPNPWPASEQAGIDQKIKAYEEELQAMTSRCATSDVCLLSPEEPMSPSGQLGGPSMQTCVKKPYCPYIGSIPTNVDTSKCIPYPIEYYRAMGLTQ